MKFKKKITQSIESRFSKLASKKNKINKKIYSLGLGEPYFETPKTISKAAYDSIKKGDTRYSDPKGYFKLRELISKKINKKFNLKSNAENYLLTTGSKFALYLTLKSILNQNDHIINMSPCYPSYEPQIYLSEPTAKLISINLDKNLSFNTNFLKKKFTKKVKAIIINSPNNPTGKIFSESELKVILSLAKKFNCWIIIDIIYGDLNYLNCNLISNRDLLNYDKLFLINGFSKSYSMTGWRIGYIYSKNKVLNLILKFNQHLINNVPLFIQKASLEALKYNDDTIKKFNYTLRHNYFYVKNKLSKFNLNIPDNVGGMFIFINVSKYGYKSDLFCELLLDKFKVAATPGIFFGRKWDSHIRISLSNNKKEFMIAINKLSKFIMSISN